MTAARLQPLLEQVGALHARLCPRQVLGVRMGLYAGELLDLDVPRTQDKRLLVFVETDGCFADGVSVATGCWVGRRTLRVVDLGKVAAVFVDTQTERALRLRPRTAARDRASEAFPDARSQWHAYLEGYASLPATALLESEPVLLATQLKSIIGQAGLRVDCTRCGEEIMNGREIQIAGRSLCLHCAGEQYYVKADTASSSLSKPRTPLGGLAPSLA